MAKYQRLAKRTSSLYDKIYGSRFMQAQSIEESSELEEGRKGSRNLYNKIYGSKKTNEDVVKQEICKDCGKPVVEGKCDCDSEYDDEF